MIYDTKHATCMAQAFCMIPNDTKDVIQDLCNKVFEALKLSPEQIYRTYPRSIESLAFYRDEVLTDEGVVFGD